MRRKILTLFFVTTGICWVFYAYYLTRTLFNDYLYNRDFTQFFLMGHALRAGVNMYGPIPVLAAQFDLNLDKWFHVAAYPPIVAVIGLPLSYLPYFWLIIAWTIFKVGCLAWTIVLVVRQFGGKSAHTPVLVTACAFIAWYPLYVELYLGQLMIPILLLLTVSWLALKADKGFRAGLLLGTVLAIKFYAWPVVLFLFIKRLWRPTLTAVIVFMVANAVMIVWAGSTTVIDYYSRVGGAVLAEYEFDPFNFSAWTIGFRSFGTLGAGMMSLAVLLCSLLFALQSRDFDSEFMVMLTASTILQPISWLHYLVTLFPAMCLVANRREFQVSELIVGLFLIFLILPGFYPLAHTYAAMATWPPFVFIIGLMWLVVPKASSKPTLPNFALETK